MILFIACSSCFFSKRKNTLNSSANLAPYLSGDSIVQSRRIEIHGYRRTLNPSLIPYENGYLLSFRYRKGLENLEKIGRKNAALIGVAKLDREFSVLPDTVQLLDVFSHSSEPSITAEDARLIQMGERIFIFFNDLPTVGKKSGFALYFAELIEEGGKFLTKGPAKLLRYAKSVSIEKNWSPFVFEEKLYAIYSDQPRVILEIDVETGECKEVSSDSSPLEWGWGRVRGGTPAYRLEDQFITFFHSSFPAAFERKGKQKKRPVYVMGMYAFDAKFPFAIRSIYPLPLGSVSDYADKNSRQVVFPCGLVVEGDFFHVAWGKNNRQIWITTFDRKKLLEKVEGSDKGL